MMTDISDGIDLMATARESLLRDVLPALPADRRYVALMIANAMAIAAREADAGVPASNGEATELQRLLASVDATPDDAAANVAQGNQGRHPRRTVRRPGVRGGAFRGVAGDDARVGRDLQPEGLAAGSGPARAAPRFLKRRWRMELTLPGHNARGTGAPGTCHL